MPQPELSAIWDPPRMAFIYRADEDGHSLGTGDFHFGAGSNVSTR